MIRNMTCEDYDQVNELWHGIKGFVLRSIDDSREGVERFIKRNPETCVVAVEDNHIVGSILCGHDGRKGGWDDRGDPRPAHSPSGQW